jgi:hypothetical protein
LVLKKEKKNVALVLASFFFFPTNYVNKTAVVGQKEEKEREMASALKGMSEGGRERGRRTKGKKKSR